MPNLFKLKEIYYINCTFLASNYSKSVGLVLCVFFAQIREIAQRNHIEFLSRCAFQMGAQWLAGGIVKTCERLYSELNSIFHDFCVQ